MFQIRIRGDVIDLQDALKKRFRDLEYLVYIEEWTAAQRAGVLEWSVGKRAQLPFHSFRRLRFPSSPMKPLQDRLRPVGFSLAVGSELRWVQLLLS